MKNLIILLAIVFVSCEKETIPNFKVGDVVIATDSITTEHPKRSFILPGDVGNIKSIESFDPVVYKVFWKEMLPSKNRKYIPSTITLVNENQIK